MRGITAYSLYVLALSLAVQQSAVVAQELEIEETFAEDEPAAPQAAIAHPVFEPYAEKVSPGAFFEQFTDGWRERWKASNAKKETPAGGDEEFSYIGRWSVEEPKVYRGLSGDKGLVVKDKAAHHAISAKFAEPIDNTDNTLVVQYEVKLQNGLDCGGAYLKLLTDEANLHEEEFSDKTSYQIMFGPDRCGSTNKVHFIVRRKSPITGEYEEKHLIGAPHMITDKLTNLYTLIVKPDQTYEIRINGDIKKYGSLIDSQDFDPAFEPPTTIPDPDDVKPEDWVDLETIPDPDQAVKPEDWDEDAPLLIPDPDAVKPDDWDESIEEYIPDPEAEKPDDWDDEEDGEWIAPVVPNPECEDHGCGPWEAPLVDNPEYKGKWVQPKIPNPEYKGPWAPRDIPNPDYYEDKTPSNLEPIGAIGFELWTMSNEILFDNIYVGHSIEEAEKIGNATYSEKVIYEIKEEESSRPKVAEPDAPKSMWELFKADPINYSLYQSELFFTFFKRDPVFAVKQYPETAAALGAVFVTILALVFGSILSLVGASKKASAPATPAPTPAAAKPAEEVEGSSSSAAGETEAKKRSAKN
ncbi:calnexin [Myxozyma melibiosi]|uniref:Calnexin n=1 Tax=Myxozyma melibiosi TaxID=54550 RepID=A0ABR1FAY9_9ASCO